MSTSHIGPGETGEDVKGYRGEYSSSAGPMDVYKVVNGQDIEELDPRHDEVNHSPSGFSWGFNGSGPAQLAYAILADAFDSEFAGEHYQQFKKDVISQLPDNDWYLTEKEIKSIVKTYV